MTSPTLMFCIGATKAGTSWLYRYLHHHDEVGLSAIKEGHFFDTMEFDDAEFQLENWANLRRDLTAKKTVAQKNANLWKEQNLQMQIDDLDVHIKAINEGELGVLTYLDFLNSKATDGVKVVGDITPGYALLSDERLKQMSELSEDVRFIYLMRDPVGRLWSHVRMQAERNCPPHRTVEAKSRGILKRVTQNGDEKHIIARGDYAATIEKLKRIIPADKLHIEFSERLYTEAGVRRLCDFLGVTYKATDTQKREHVGAKIELKDDMRDWAAGFLAPQYAYVKENIGELPEKWAANMMRVS